MIFSCSSVIHSPAVQSSLDGGLMHIKSDRFFPFFSVGLSTAALTPTKKPLLAKERGANQQLLTLTRVPGVILDKEDSFAFPWQLLSEQQGGRKSVYRK